MNARHLGSAVGHVSDLTRCGILNGQVGDLTYNRSGRPASTDRCHRDRPFENFPRKQNGYVWHGRLARVLTTITGETLVPLVRDGLFTRCGERVEWRNFG